MAKLLYFNDDDGREVPRHVWEQMIAEARNKAGLILTQSGDPEAALNDFAESMKNIERLLEIYRQQFGDPYAPAPKD